MRLAARAEEYAYERRFYRQWSVRKGFFRFETKIAESDLFILSDQKDIAEAEAALRQIRSVLEGYIESHPLFKTSLESLEVLTGSPAVIQEMAKAGAVWQVGPMAAVAGAVSSHVAEALLENAQTVIVENGGDIYAKSPKPLTFALYAGEDSPFAGRLAFEIDMKEGLGICTSSGKVGPSLSFGKADAVVAIHKSAVFADAAATSIANRIAGPTDVAKVVKEEQEADRLDGLIVCSGDQLGMWGDFEVKKRQLK